MARHRLVRFVVMLLFALAAPVATVYAQAPSAAADSTAQRVRLDLRDGSSLIGRIIAEDDTTITFRTTSGVTVTVSRAQVARIVPIESREGRYRLDPNRTRLLFTPTGRSLRYRQGYIADYELFFPFVAYGVGRGVNLAAGISLIPFAPAQLLYAAPKVTVYETPRSAFAVGTLIGTVVGDVDGSGSAGLLYGIGTFGASEGAVTAGLAFGFVDGELARRPAIMVGGERQVSNSVKLLTENYVLLPEDEGAIVLLSAGVRFFGETLATDIAIVTSPDLITEGGFPFFPFVGFAYNFGAD